MKIEEVKEIWERVLGISNLDIDKRFYDMGGNSITLLIILDEINKATGIQLDITEMNRFDTISNMYECIEAQNN